MKPACMPSVDRVRDLLEYNPLTGKFTWKVPRGPRRAGALAAHHSRDGYLYIMIDGRRFGAHRVAFLHIHGKEPCDQIDHINGDRCDNRIANLRECTNAENKQNMRRARSDSQTGLLGVAPDGNRFRACIRHHGKTKSLGTYDKPEQAHAAYLQAKAELHPFAPRNGVCEALEAERVKVRVLTDALTGRAA